VVSERKKFQINVKRYTVFFFRHSNAMEEGTLPGIQMD